MEDIPAGTTYVNDDKAQKHKHDLSEKEKEFALAVDENTKNKIKIQLENMKSHEKYFIHESRKPVQPIINDKKFLNYEGDVDNKFDNDDNAKFKYGRNNHFESIFTMKNLINKNCNLDENANSNFLFYIIIIYNFYDINKLKV